MHCTGERKVGEVTVLVSRITSVHCLRKGVHVLC
jgi:hypothetical protein